MTNSLTFRLRVCVSAVEKRGPALLEVVTSPCLRSIHPGSKPAARVRACVRARLSIFVFLLGSGLISEPLG